MGGEPVTAGASSQAAMLQDHIWRLEAIKTEQEETLTQLQQEQAQIRQALVTAQQQSEALQAQVIQLERSVRQWQQKVVVGQDQEKKEAISGIVLEVNQQQKALTLQTKNRDIGKMEAPARVLDTLQNGEKVEGGVLKEKSVR